MAKEEESNKNRDLQEEEVKKNYKYFKNNYSSILDKYPNKKFILLKDQKVVGAFDTLDDAKEASRLIYKKEERFSIQELNPLEVNLGYQSYALS